jgi:hypothetical protein
MQFFNIHEGRVYYRTDTAGNDVYLLKQADAKSFEELNHLWGRDARSVFCAFTRVKAADRGSFEVLNAIFARDRQSVYHAEGILKEADRDTFQVLDSGEQVIDGWPKWRGYASDKDNAYFHDLMGGKPRAIKKADLESFRTLSQIYAVDARAVYCEGQVLKPADPKTFEVLGNTYARDKHHGFWGSRVIECNPAKLRELDFEFATDDSQAFHWGRPLLGAHVPTFQPLFHLMAHDSLGLFYCETRVVEEGWLNVSLWKPRALFDYLLDVYGRGASLMVDNAPFTDGQLQRDNLCDRCLQATMVGLDRNGNPVKKNDWEVVKLPLPEIQMTRNGEVILFGPQRSGDFRAPRRQWRQLLEPFQQKLCVLFPAGN